MSKEELNLDYQKAYEVFKETMREGNYLLAVKSALEKQIPKKVTHEATLYKCCTCPNCKNVVDEFTDFAGKKVRLTVIHCKFCGQALDWSDTE